MNFGYSTAIVAILACFYKLIMQCWKARRPLFKPAVLAEEP